MGWGGVGWGVGGGMGVKGGEGVVKGGEGVCVRDWACLSLKVLEKRIEGG